MCVCIGYVQEKWLGGLNSFLCLKVCDVSLLVYNKVGPSVTTNERVTPKFRYKIMYDFRVSQSFLFVYWWWSLKLKYDDNVDVPDEMWVVTLMWSRR